MRSLVTFWVNQSPFLLCSQQLVWRFHYRGKPLAFGPQDITREGSTDIWTWGGGAKHLQEKKKKECKKTVWDLMANWGGVSGIRYPRVDFSDNDTAGMLITTHCAGDLNVSWAQMWFSVSYWSLRELFSAAGADWLLTYWFAHHPAVQGGLTAPLLFSSVVIRSCK